jgi:hypothetical protein
MKYSIDTWIKVLEELRYKVGDEMSKSGSDINYISFSKQTSTTFKTIIQIFFNYKTSEVTSIYIREHSAFPNIDDKMISPDDFINEYLQYFRDQQINLLIDGNSNETINYINYMVKSVEVKCSNNFKYFINYFTFIIDVPSLRAAKATTNISIDPSGNSLSNFLVNLATFISLPPSTFPNSKSFNIDFAILLTLEDSCPDSLSNIVLTEESITIESFDSLNFIMCFIVLILFFIFYILRKKNDF